MIKETMVSTLSSREVSSQLNALSRHEAASIPNFRKPSIAKIGSVKSSFSKLRDLMTTSERCATMVLRFRTNNHIYVLVLNTGGKAEADQC